MGNNNGGEINIRIADETAGSFCAQDAQKLVDRIPVGLLNAASIEKEWAVNFVTGIQKHEAEHYQPERTVHLLNSIYTANSFDLSCMPVFCEYVPEMRDFLIRQYQGFFADPANVTLDRLLLADAIVSSMCYPGDTTSDIYAQVFDAAWCSIEVSKAESVGSFSVSLLDLVDTDSVFQLGMSPYTARKIGMVMEYLLTPGLLPITSDIRERLLGYIREIDSVLTELPPDERTLLD